MRAAADRLRAIYTSLAPARRALADGDARTLRLQVALAEIPSPTGAERRRGGAVRTAMQQQGYVPLVDEVGNVTARLEGTTDAPPVVVCAHLDTVFPDTVTHHIVSEAGRLIGPGIGDNARGLAAMVRIAGVLRERGGLLAPILFAATVGEEGEGDLRGARHLFANAGAAAAAAVVIDGAGDERVVTHALGTRRYRVSFESQGGHSWAASDAPNPVHAAARLAAAVAALPRPTTPRSTLAVTRLHGGSAVNAIPAHACIDVDTRSSSTRVLDEWESRLRRLAHEALDWENALRGPQWQPMRLRFEVSSDRPAGVAPSDSSVVRAALVATECIGRRAECAIASTDANIPLSLGIPAVTIGGGGRGGDTHTPHEWFENREGALGLARALTVIAATAGAA
jgi:acetylornithine deacetylase/succinyl-diaminopimelate desuccinylase-like protein